MILSMYSSTQNTSGVVVQPKKKSKKEEQVSTDIHGHDVLLYPSTRRMNALIEHPDRWSIVCACLELMEPSILPDTLPNLIAQHVGLEFSISLPQVQNIWHEFYNQKEAKIKHMISNAHGQAVQNGKMGEVEEKTAVTLADFNTAHHFKDRVDMDGKTHSFDDVLTMIVAVNSEVDGRASVRDLSGELLKQCNMLIPKSTLDRILVDYRFLFHKNYLKPSLSRKNRLDRAIYCFGKIDLSQQCVTDDDGQVCLRFNDQQYKSEMVLDEKLYYIDVIKARQRYSAMDLLVKHHARKVYSKTQMPSLMFLVALLPPQMSPDNRTYCDGKICCKSFAELRHAVRGSKNRPQGTLEVVGYNVDAESFFEMMTADDGVIASVREKLPWLVNEPLQITLSDGEDEDGADDAVVEGGVRVRMDNAKPHIGKDNVEKLNTWARNEQINVSFVLQPAQSPDLNLLDLCIFKGLSRAANNYAVHSKNVDDILYNVMHTFEAYPSDTIARAVAFQFSVYREVLKAHGNNTYELPHSNIRKRQLAGEEEIDFKIRKEVVLSAAGWIRDEVTHFSTLATTGNDAMGGKSEKKKALQAEKHQWDEKKVKWEELFAAVSKL